MYHFLLFPRTNRIRDSVRLFNHFQTKMIYDSTRILRKYEY